MSTTTQPESYWQRDQRLASEGVPVCPQCGERDRVKIVVGVPWCDRCIGFLPNLQPPPGRHVPDF